MNPPARLEEPACVICRSPFDGEVHLPKVLQCLHTFCLQCLRQMRWGAKWGSIRCPLCRYTTLLPDGSLQNLPVNSKVAKGCPGSPAVPLQTWAPASRRPPQALSRRPPQARRRSPAAQVEARGWSSARMCSLLILLLVGVGTAVAAITVGLQQQYTVLLVFLIVVSTFCFFSFCCSIFYRHGSQQHGVRGRRVVSSQQRWSPHFGDDQPWCATAVPWTSWGGHVGTGGGGCHVDSDMTSGNSGFGGCHVDSGMTSGDGGFGGCHMDSGMSSEDCGFSECNVDSGFDGCNTDSGCCGD